MYVPRRAALNGEMAYLPHAVDHGGEILGNHITKNRDKAAALAFIQKALTRHEPPAKMTRAQVLRNV